MCRLIKKYGKQMLFYDTPYFGTALLRDTAFLRRMGWIFPARRFFALLALPRCRPGAFWHKAGRFKGAFSALDGRALRLVQSRKMLYTG